MIASYRIGFGFGWKKKTKAEMAHRTESDRAFDRMLEPDLYESCASATAYCFFGRESAATIPPRIAIEHSH